MGAIRELIDRVNTADVAYDVAAIQKVNRQRFEFSQLDGVVHLDLAGKEIVGLKNVHKEEFWVRGHIPGKPLLPGVLMLETAAQLTSFYFSMSIDPEGKRFIGFGGLERVRFKRPVKPGDRLVIGGINTKLNRRIAKFDVEGYVGKELAFSAIILGVPMNI